MLGWSGPVGWIAGALFAALIALLVFLVPDDRSAAVTGGGSASKGDGRKGSGTSKPPTEGRRAKGSKGSAPVDVDAELAATTSVAKPTKSPTAKRSKSKKR
jgi:hypothetical protein